MPTAITASRAALLKNSLRKSLYLAAMTACLWPALAAAQPPDPTGSDANHNTAAGANALLNVTGSGFFNTAIGDSALKSTTSGSGNTAAGFNALLSNTTGFGNAALGDAALQSNTTGVRNSASGSNALSANTTGSDNTATGAYALDFNTTGSFNTASGSNALITNTTGSYNTGSGGFALTRNTTGRNNTASGYTALQSNTTGSNNVAMGYNALGSLNSGNSNIALGTNAGKSITSGAGNIYVGNTGAAGGSENRVIRIGQTQTKAFIAGIARTHMSGATVVIRANGQLGVVASSARYKTEIHDLADRSDRLAQLRPVSYQYKAEPGVTHYGLIAEEVDKVMPELVVRDEQNRPETVQYHELIPLLLQQVKAQRALIEQQTEAASRDHAMIERLAAKVDELSRARLAAR